MHLDEVFRLKHLYIIIYPYINAVSCVQKFDVSVEELCEDTE